LVYRTKNQCPSLGSEGSSQGMGYPGITCLINGNRAFSCFMNRDYGNRDYRNRDYRNRDYRNRDYGNRDYGNRDYWINLNNRRNTN